MMKMTTPFFSLLFLLAFVVNVQAQCHESSLSITRPENPLADTLGPFCAGEEVQFCYNLKFQSDNQGTGNNCTWLQGIIPKIGSGWDLQASNILNSSPPDFTFFPQGSVDYDFGGSLLHIYENDRDSLEICHASEANCSSHPQLMKGDSLPAGWWATSPGNPNFCTNDGDPDNMYGLPQGCGTVKEIEFCFSLITKGDSMNCATNEDLDLTLGFYIFDDGETGCWIDSNTCSNFTPLVQRFDLRCNCDVTTIAGNQNCPDTLRLINHNLLSDTFKAESVIIAKEDYVLPGSNVLFTSGSEIYIPNDFEVFHSAIFEAKIDTCSAP